VIVVVGIGADGWDGLGASARRAVLGADEVIGSERQLALLPDDAPPRRRWPSPLQPLLDELLARDCGTTCVLASGDPMLHGIGATLARRGASLTVIPHPSAFALACARLAWPAADVDLVSAVARPADAVAALLQPRRRIVAYVTGADGAARIAAVLRDRGYGPSRLTVLEQLGAAGERRVDATADDYDAAADPLHVVAIECAAAAGTPLHQRSPGLPDDAYEHDGQLTKRPVRAITLAALGPAPRALLWDVGAGSGSIGIEWLRAEPTARAIAVEPRDDRADRVMRNATTLGVPHLELVRGEAPDALVGLEPPDAIFIGGGLTAPGVLDACWDALAPAGRLVANAVTLESEQVAVAARERLGGDLVRIDIAHAAPIGGFTGWRPQMALVQWSVRKP